jgi:hypothetical protein
MWKDGEEDIDLRKDGFTVLEDIRKMDLSDEITTDRGELKEKTCCADFKSIRTRAERRIKTYQTFPKLRKALPSSKLKKLILGNLRTDINLPILYIYCKHINIVDTNSQTRLQTVK